MSRILVDTSIWIDYFRSKGKHTILDELITNNQVCTNDLILAELIPFIHSKGNEKLVESLLSLIIYRIHIDWDQIIKFQIINLQNGINRVGIPDLIILENVIDNDLFLFTADKHFHLMTKLFHLKLFEYE